MALNDRYICLHVFAAHTINLRPLLAIVRRAMARSVKGSQEGVRLVEMLLHPVVTHLQWHE